MFLSILKKRIRQLWKSIHQLKGTRPVKAYYGSLLVGWFGLQICQDAVFELRVLLKRRAEALVSKKRQLSIFNQALNPVREGHGAFKNGYRFLNVLSSLLGFPSSVFSNGVKRRKVLPQFKRAREEDVSDCSDCSLSLSKGTIRESKFDPLDKLRDQILAKNPTFAIQAVRPAMEMRELARAKAKRLLYLQKTLRLKVKTDLSAIGFAVKAVPEYQSPIEILANRIYAAAVLVYTACKNAFIEATVASYSMLKRSALAVLQAAATVKNSVVARAVSSYALAKRTALVLKALTTYYLLLTNRYLLLTTRFSQRFLTSARQSVIRLAVWARDFARRAIIITVRYCEAALRRSNLMAVFVGQIMLAAAQKTAHFLLRVFRLSDVLIHQIAAKIATFVLFTPLEKLRNAVSWFANKWVNFGRLFSNIIDSLTGLMGTVYLQGTRILTRIMTRTLTRIALFIVFLRLWTAYQARKFIEYLKLALPAGYVWAIRQARAKAAAAVEGLLVALLAITIYIDKLKLVFKRVYAVLSIITFKYYKQGQTYALGLMHKLQYGAEMIILSLDITATRFLARARTLLAIAFGYGLIYGQSIYKGAVYVFIATADVPARALDRVYEKFLGAYHLLRPPAPPGRWHYSNLRPLLEHQKLKSFGEPAGGVSSVWKKTFASLALAFMLLFQAGPVLAETTIITDADVSPSQPVLQQIATLDSNVPDSTLAQIVKKVEDLVKPPTPPAPPASDSGGATATATTAELPPPDQAGQLSGQGATSTQPSALAPPDNPAATNTPDSSLDPGTGTTTPPTASSTSDTPASTTPLSSPSASFSPASAGGAGQSLPQCLPAGEAGVPKSAGTQNQGSTASGSGIIGESGISENQSQASGAPDTLATTTPPVPVSAGGGAGTGQAEASTTSPLILPPDPAAGSSSTPTLLTAQSEATTTPQSANSDQAGCDDGLKSAALGNQQITTGDGSQLDIKNQSKNLVDIINTNTIKVINEVKGQAVTGLNEIEAQGRGKDAAIETGDINVFANVLNVVNTNLIHSKIVEIAQNFNNLSADVLLNHPETSPAEVSQDLVAQVCGVGVSCQSLNSFTLTNQNNAEVENNVGVFGDSGQNSLKNIERRGTIRSGNVNALVNILNIVNTNLVNSRWTIASINIFGDFKGDLVLPSELYFTDFMSIGAEAHAAVNVEDIQKVLINVHNDNQTEVNNNVNTAADSGQNNLEATGTPDHKRGGMDNAEISAGDSRGESNVHNVLNTNVLNGRWYLGMVNTLGQWAGNVFSLPDQVAMGTTPTGLTFFSSTAKDNDLTLKVFEDTVAKIQNDQQTGISINNQNQAKITNNVDLGALSGANDISAEKIVDGGIFSGNTYALANILNFANTNLVNADLQIGLVNVFGKWDGNIVFGFPDLVVSQALAQDAYPKEKNSRVAYTVAYENKGDASMINTALEWRYDPQELSFLSAAPDVPYSRPEPGAVIFQLDKVGPRASGVITIKAKTLKNLPEGTEVTAYARISGIGAEREKGNNEAVLNVQAQNTNKAYVIPDPPAPPPVSSGSSSGSSGSGSSGAGSGGSGGTDANGSNNSQSSFGQGAGANGSTPPAGNNSAGQNGSASGSDNLGSQNNGSSSASGSSTSSSSSNSNPASAGSDTPANPNQNSGGGQQVSYTSPLAVILINDAASRSLKPGDKVNFTLTVGNAGQTQLYNIVVYSVIRGSDNKIVMAKQFPFNKLQSEEGAEISYELEVTGITPDGVYTNSAYAEAVNFQFQKIKSNTAVNTFTVANLKAQDSKGMAAGQQDQSAKKDGVFKDTSLTDNKDKPADKAEAAPDPDQPQNESAKTVSTSTPPLIMGNVKGVKINHTSSILRSTPSAAIKTALPAEAGVIDEVIIPALQRDVPETNPLDQFMTIGLVCLLIAFGYALSNLRQRLKVGNQRDN